LIVQKNFIPKLLQQDDLKTELIL